MPIWEKPELTQLTAARDSKNGFFNSTTEFIFILNDSRAPS